MSNTEEIHGIYDTGTLRRRSIAGSQEICDIDLLRRRYTKATQDAEILSRHNTVRIQEICDAEPKKLECASKRTTSQHCDRGIVTKPSEPRESRYEDKQENPAIEGESKADLKGRGRATIAGRNNKGNPTIYSAGEHNKELKYCRDEEISKTSNSQGRTTYEEYNLDLEVWEGVSKRNNGDNPVSCDGYIDPEGYRNKKKNKKE